MGRKRKNKTQESRPFCFFCNKRYTDEALLIKHQQQIHFRCIQCGKKVPGLLALETHLSTVHKITAKNVPGSLPDRDTFQYNILGMNGVPIEVIQAESKRIKGAVESDEEEGEEEAAPNEPPAAAGSAPAPPPPPPASVPYYRPPPPPSAGYIPPQPYYNYAQNAHYYAQYPYPPMQTGITHAPGMLPPPPPPPPSSSLPPSIPPPSAPITPNTQPVASNNLQKEEQVVFIYSNETSSMEEARASKYSQH